MSKSFLLDFALLLCSLWALIIASCSGKFEISRQNLTTKSTEIAENFSTGNRRYPGLISKFHIPYDTLENFLASVSIGLEGLRPSPLGGVCPTKKFTFRVQISKQAKLYY